MSNSNTSGTRVTFESDAMRISKGRVEGFIPECSEQGCVFFGISFTVTVNRKSLKRLPFYGNP